LTRQRRSERLPGPVLQDDSSLLMEKMPPRSPLLPASWDLPEAISSRIGDTVGPQRAMVHDGHLLLLLHAVPEPDNSQRKPVLIWRAPQGDWRWNEGPESGPDLIGRHLRTFREAVRDLERRSAIARDAADWFNLIRASAPIHRTARHMTAALQRAREALPDLRLLIVARDEAVELERAAELVHDEAEQGLRFAQARQTERMSRTSHRLNLMVALLLPTTAVAGIFAIDSIAPRVEIAWLALGTTAALGLLLAIGIARRHGGYDSGPRRS